MLDVAVIGAGPYGLSVAAHFRSRGIACRVFGRPMDTWLAHMPKGMLLKSDGFASDLYDPEREFTLKRFCAQRGIDYGDTGVPVRLETFAAYGLAFKERMVPDLEDRLLSAVDHLPSGFRLRFDDGDTVRARRVVLAVGITHFEHVPSRLAPLPPEALSHSSRHHDLEPLRGRSVAVIGGGASALDLAGLLHEAGVEVQLVSRQKELNFHTKPTGKARSWWQQVRHPPSGLGPGMRSRFFANAPLLFHYLPERLRLEAVHRSLGPSGGWFSKDMVMGRVPLRLGYSLKHARIEDGLVHLRLCGIDGSQRDIRTQHVIAATGYKVDTERLTFLSKTMRSTLRTVSGAPCLNANFESSIPGLYFVGIAAANSFGPVMRFAFGAGFAADRLTSAVARSLILERTSVAATRLVPDSE